MSKLYISIPAAPPSVNHYVKHTRMGRHYKTQEALSFQILVALSAKGKSQTTIEATEVVITITLGPKMKLDIDNGAKVLLDSLVRCGVIRSDASITHLEVSKCRGEHAQTEVWIS